MNLVWDCKSCCVSAALRISHGPSDSCSLAPSETNLFSPYSPGWSAASQAAVFVIRNLSTSSLIHLEAFKVNTFACRCQNIPSPVSTFRSSCIPEAMIKLCWEILKRKTCVAAFCYIIILFSRIFFTIALPLETLMLIYGLIVVQYIQSFEAPHHLNVIQCVNLEYSLLAK